MNQEARPWIVVENREGTIIHLPQDQLDALHAIQGFGLKVKPSSSSINREIIDGHCTNPSEANEERNQNGR